jgi:hypothetical protein
VPQLTAHVAVANGTLFGPEAIAQIQLIYYFSIVGSPGLVPLDVGMIMLIDDNTVVGEASTTIFKANANGGADGTLLSTSIQGGSLNNIQQLQLDANAIYGVQMFELERAEERVKWK